LNKRQFTQFSSETLSQIRHGVERISTIMMHPTQQLLGSKWLFTQPGDKISQARGGKIEQVDTLGRSHIDN
jgi:hypothetical protein